MTPRELNDAANVYGDKHLDFETLSRHVRNAVTNVKTCEPELFDQIIDRWLTGQSVAPPIVLTELALLLQSVSPLNRVVAHAIIRGHVAYLMGETIDAKLDWLAAQHGAKKKDGQ